LELLAIAEMEELMASPTAAEFVAQAEHEIGVPYVYGGWAHG
jgi:cell wall-associated NlpC family hydrolase